MLKDQVLAVADIEAISRETTSVSFKNCKSKEWKQVGELLASLPELSAVDVEECDSSDQLCVAVSTSKNLQKLKMGKNEGDSENCSLTDQGVRELLAMRQLREVRLGAAGEGPACNKFTGEGFRAVLKAIKVMPGLAVL